MTTEARIAYRPNSAAAAAGVGRDLIYAAIKDGSLRSFKIGGARLITVDALREWLAAYEREQAPA